VPELPEVETVRRTLTPAIGRRITSVWGSGKPLRMNRPVDLEALEEIAVGAVIEGIRRIGKYLLVDLADRPACVVVHLGMSGRFRVVARGAPHVDHTHIVFATDGDRELRFSDPRRFGLVALAPAGAAAMAHPLLAGLGPDPLASPIDVARFHALAHRSKQTLKAILLDQSVLAGLGNIYVSEALWRARIRPTRRGRALSRAEAETLMKAVVAVLEAALDKGGTSLRDFVDADGREGENAAYLKVYDRGGAPCPRRGCDGRIRRAVMQGRATFFCPTCQPR
jgi:formamidopyrimidine-DNA glycosylase